MEMNHLFDLSLNTLEHAQHFRLIDYSRPACSTAQSKHIKTRAMHSHPKSETQTRCEAVYDHSQMCELPL